MFKRNILVGLIMAVFAFVFSGCVSTTRTVYANPTDSAAYSTSNYATSSYAYPSGYYYNSYDRDRVAYGYYGNNGTTHRGYYAYNRGNGNSNGYYRGNGRDRNGNNGVGRDGNRGNGNGRDRDRTANNGRDKTNSRSAIVSNRGTVSNNRTISPSVIGKERPGKTHYRTSIRDTKALQPRVNRSYNNANISSTRSNRVASRTSNTSRF